jgi:hypothetical protein
VWVTAQGDFADVRKRPLNLRSGVGHLAARLQGKQTTTRIEAALTASLDTLNAETQSRDPAKFSTLLGGSVGVGGVYDAFRRSAAFVSGQKFDASHMSQKEKPA